MQRITLHRSPGISLEVVAGASIVDHFTTLFPQLVEKEVIACEANGVMINLHSPLMASTKIEPILTNSDHAWQIKRRSLCFLVAALAQTVLPQRTLVIGHAIGQGFFYHFAPGDLDLPELELLRRAISETIVQHLPIKSLRLNSRELSEYLTIAHRNDTLQLLGHHNENILDCYQFGQFIDIDHGILASWTDQLPKFSLTAHNGGFILDFPGDDANVLAPNPKRSPLIFSIYQEYKQWGKILGFSSVGHLNDKIAQRRIKDFIWVAEGLHQQKIAELSSLIAERAGRLKVILIAGPSSSGKTTFAKKLAIQLAVIGLKPIALSLDDYFVPRNQTPRDDQGNYDFEHIKALDIALLNQNLLALFNGTEIELPSFDFREGQRKYSGKKLTLPTDGVIVIEGIHGLNPELTQSIPSAAKYHIYTSALTQLNIDNLNRISTTDNRLLRRIVRDNHYRGHSAEATLAMWPSVRRGEDRNIFPFQDSADCAFNSALDYELGVLKPYAEPLLESVGPTNPNYHEARRLLHFLQSFLPIPAENVPENSILREFIGGSTFKY